MDSLTSESVRKMAVAVDCHSRIGSAVLGPAAEIDSSLVVFQNMLEMNKMIGSRRLGLEGDDDLHEQFAALRDTTEKEKKKMYILSSSTPLDIAACIASGVMIDISR